MKGFAIFVIALAILGTLICAALPPYEGTDAARLAAEDGDMPTACIPFVIVGFGGVLALFHKKVVLGE